MLHIALKRLFHHILQQNDLGIRIEKNVIKTEFNKLSANYDYLVVEGAGGITCPFNIDDEILLLPDVIKELGTDI